MSVDTHSGQAVVVVVFVLPVFWSGGCLEGVGQKNSSWSDTCDTHGGDSAGPIGSDVQEGILRPDSWLNRCGSLRLRTAVVFLQAVQTKCERRLSCQFKAWRPNTSIKHEPKEAFCFLLAIQRANFRRRLSFPSFIDAQVSFMNGFSFRLPLVGNLGERWEPASPARNHFRFSEKWYTPVQAEHPASPFESLWPVGQIWPAV